jgi:hypothetical protein
MSAPYPTLRLKDTSAFIGLTPSLTMAREEWVSIGTLAWVLLPLEPSRDHLYESHPAATCYQEAKRTCKGERR